MAGNQTLELSIKIAGKVDKSLINAINNAQRNVSGLSTTFSKVGTAGLAAMGAMATGTVTTLVKCTDAAKNFESQMSDVVKYVDGLADANGHISDKMASNGATYVDNYAMMSEAILDLSKEIPYTAEELTRLSAAAGQSGKSMDDLIGGGFLKDVAMMGTAWDISADQAGDWAAKWEVAFGKNHKEIMELANQINYLGAHNATTAAEIGEVVNEAAGLGQVAGMDVDATAALGTAMLAMGVDTAKAANSINRIYTNMSKGASATKAQREMWQELGFSASEVAASMQSDASGTLLKVFEAIQQMPDERQVAAISTLFGQWAITGAAKLTGNLDTFKQALSDVNNPDLFNGSMAREFVIKSETSEALDTRMASALNAFQIDIGNAFLPAKREISLAVIGFLDKISSMPELTRVAETLASMLSTGITNAGEALENAMPTIERVLGYLADHGPEVVSVLEKISVAFAAMKFAPGIESLLHGAGGLVFGSRTGGNTNTGSGGLFGMLGNVFKGGQNVAAAVPGAASGAASWIQSFIGATKGNMALTGRTGITGFLGTAASSLTSGLGNTGIGKYLGGIRSSLGNFLNVSGITGVVRGTVSTGGEILSGIVQATGLTDLVNGGIGLAKTGVGKAVGGVSTLASNVVNSAPAQAIGGFAGRIVSSAPVHGIASVAKGATGWIGGTAKSGAGLLSSVLGPAVSGFGGILSGALPVVGVISSVIAGASLLYDNMDGLGQIIKTVFGGKAFQGFKKFQDGLDDVVESVGMLLSGDFTGFTANLRGALFGENGMFHGNELMAGVFDSLAVGDVTKAVAPLREKLFGSFNEGTGTMMGGMFSGKGANTLVRVFDTVVKGAQTLVNIVTPILKSVLGVVGQVVTFANTTVKPIIQEIYTFITQTVMPVILQIFTTAAPIISNILSNIGTAVMAVAQFIGTAIQTVLPIVENIISVVMSIAGVVVPAVLTGIEALSAGITPIIESIQTVFNGLIDFITGIFTGNWTQAWEGVKNIFGGAFDALVGLLKTPFNAVIALINKAISGINELGLDIPDWVPLIGGNKFSINIPELPMLAKGGFTSGPSIAGEAGTEAVISFQRSARASNIATWAKAGQMLGVSNKPARLETFDFDGDVPNWPIGNGGGAVTITYSPTIIVQGNASRDDIDGALRDDKARFEAWYEEKRRSERRARW